MSIGNLDPASTGGGSLSPVIAAVFSNPSFKIPESLVKVFLKSTLNVAIINTLENHQPYDLCSVKRIQGVFI